MRLQAKAEGDAETGHRRVKWPGMTPEREREVERTLVTLGGTAAGMDKHKLISGLRERIAKKHGFVL